MRNKNEIIQALDRIEAFTALEAEVTDLREQTRKDREVIERQAKAIQGFRERMKKKGRSAPFTEEEVRDCKMLLSNTPSEIVEELNTWILEHDRSAREIMIGSVDNYLAEQEKSDKVTKEWKKASLAHTKAHDRLECMKARIRDALSG